MELEPLLTNIAHFVLEHPPSPEPKILDQLLKNIAELSLYPESDKTTPNFMLKNLSFLAKNLL